MNIKDIKSPADLADNHDLEAYLRATAAINPNGFMQPFVLAAADEIKRLREAGLSMGGMATNEQTEVVLAAFAVVDAQRNLRSTYNATGPDAADQEQAANIENNHANDRLTMAVDATRRTAWGRKGGIPVSGALRGSRERQRQITVLGYTADRDAGYLHGQLAAAALCYLEAHLAALTFVPEGVAPHVTEIMAQRWPWLEEYFEWEGNHPLRNLEKASGLIAAEMDRVQAELVRLGKPVPPAPMVPAPGQKGACPDAA